MTKYERRNTLLTLVTLAVAIGGIAWGEIKDHRRTSTELRRRVLQAYHLGYNVAAVQAAMIVGQREKRQLPENAHDSSLVRIQSLIDQLDLKLSIKRPPTPWEHWMTAHDIERYIDANFPVEVSLGYRLGVLAGKARFLSIADRYGEIGDLAKSPDQLEQLRKADKTIEQLGLRTRLSPRGQYDPYEIDKQIDSLEQELSARWR